MANSVFCEESRYFLKEVKKRYEMNKIIQNKVNRLIINITILIILINLFQSCNNLISPDDKTPIIDTLEVCKDTTLIPLNTNELLPLTVGNWWEYELQTFIYGGDNDTTILINYGVQQIKEKHYSLYNCCLYETVVYDRGFGGSENWLYWQDSTGVYSLGGFSDVDSLINKSLISKYPVEKGESWMSQNVYFDKLTRKFVYGDSIKYTCVSINKEFDTPIGKISCYVFYYRTDIASDVIGFYDTYDYISPGIGLVGQEVFITNEELGDTTSSIQYIAKLIHYSIKN